MDVPISRRTFEQLWEDAKERRFVRWLPSGVVEQLRIAKNGKSICAYGPYTADHYIVSNRPAYTSRTFGYELVTAENPGTKEEIYEAAKKTRHFVSKTAKKKAAKKAKEEADLLPIPEKV